MLGLKKTLLIRHGLAVSFWPYETEQRMFRLESVNIRWFRGNKDRRSVGTGLWAEDTELWYHPDQNQPFNIAAVVREIGTSRSDIDGTRKVLVHGEFWEVESQHKFAKGEQVRVEYPGAHARYGTRVQGLI